MNVEVEYRLPELPRGKGDLIKVRCSEQFRDWVDGLAAHTCRNRACVVEAGLRLIAQQVKFKPAPPRV